MHWAVAHFSFNSASSRDNIKKQLITSAVPASVCAQYQLQMQMPEPRYNTKMMNIGKRKADINSNEQRSTNNKRNYKENRAQHVTKQRRKVGGFGVTEGVHAEP